MLIVLTVLLWQIQISWVYTFVSRSDVSHPGHRWKQGGIWELIILLCIIIGCVKGWVQYQSFTITLGLVIVWEYSTQQ